MGDAARMHHHANRTAAALLFILSLVPLQVNCTCTSRPIDSYVGHNNSRCRQHHPAVTTTTDGVDQQQTPSISIPSGHFEPIDLAPFDLGSPHRNLSTAEMDHVLDHPFWLACLHRVLDVQLPHKHTTAHDITLVTHTTISRLHQVGQQCAAWPGSLVVAVYVPLSHDGIHVAPREGTTLHAQLSQLAARAATIHGRGSCALRLVAYTERLPPDAHTDPLRHVYQYPINAMRNRALLAARTDLVMLVDGDLVPGPRWFLESIMHQADNGYIAALAAQCRARRAVAVVLPFELDSDATRRAQEALASKQHIRFLWRRGDVRLFYPDFHANTDAQRWAEMDAPYAVPYVQGNGSTASFYEPYVLGLRSGMPLCDERFRGWYVNKISCVFQLHTTGWSFIVEPNMFLLHIPHPSDVSEDKEFDAFVKIKHHLWLQRMGGAHPAAAQPHTPMMSSCGL